MQAVSCCRLMVESQPARDTRIVAAAGKYLVIATTPGSTSQLRLAVTRAGRELGVGYV
jgi:hypothetical protein